MDSSCLFYLQGMKNQPQMLPLHVQQPKQQFKQTCLLVMKTCVTTCTVIIILVMAFIDLFSFLSSALSVLDNGSLQRNCSPNVSEKLYYTFIILVFTKCIYQVYVYGFILWENNLIFSSVELRVIELFYLPTIFLMHNFRLLH